MKLNEVNKEHSIIKEALLANIDLQYGRLSLCNINNHQVIQRVKCWQVHCEYGGHKHSQLYASLDEAIEKFISLKERVKRFRWTL